MELLRVRKGKCGWIILAVLATFMLFTGYTAKLMAGDEYQQMLSQMEQSQSTDAENFNLGINFNIEPQNISLESFIISFYNSGFLLLLTGIFTIIFVSGESHTGYIKNIAGVVKRRWYLVVSKNVVIALYILAEIVVLLLFGLLAMVLFGVEGERTLSMDLLKLTLLQYGLQIAFSMLSMLLYILLRSRLVSIIISVCLTTGLGVLMFSYVDKILEKSGVVISKYLITINAGTIASYNNEIALRVLGIFLFACVVYNGISCFVFQNRDIR